MYKHIRAAVFLLDEAVAFAAVEHFTVPFGMRNILLSN